LATRKHVPAWRDGHFCTSDGTKPAEEWLDSLDQKAAAEVVSVVLTVRDAPPPAFAGGGKWEAMHGDMADLYEVRCRRGDTLHRLFCVLDRNHPAGPALVMLDGDSKPNRRKMPGAVYERVRRRRDEYHETRRVDFG
jgi:Txe/YoeB family toxin of Txe-Axe toxin-antitoxin module